MLGELTAPDKPSVVGLTITGMGPLQPAAGRDNAGMSAELSGTVEVGGRRAAFKAIATLRHHDGKGDEKNPALMLEARAVLKSADLGLKALPAVELRFSLTDYPPQAAAVPAKK